MSNRRDICMACEHSDHDGIGDAARLTCDLVVDERGRPVPCRLRRMLADPEARCPHPDADQARVWNEAAPEALGGCGGADRAGAAAPERSDRITERVRACIGNGPHAPPCPWSEPGWVCARLGRPVNEELKLPSFACPAGRFAAETEALA